MRWPSVEKHLKRLATVSSGAGEKDELIYRNTGSVGFNPNSFLRNAITAWKRFDEVILKKFCFMIGAEPVALNRTTTFEGSRCLN